MNYLLSLEYDVLTRAVDLGAPATDDGSAAALKPARLEEYLDERVVVSLDGAACEPALQSTTTSPARPSKSYADSR